MMAMPHFKTDFLISAGQFTFICSWNHQECNSGVGGGGGGGGVGVGERAMYKLPGAYTRVEL